MASSGVCADCRWATNKGNILMRTEQSLDMALEGAQSANGLARRVILIHVYECIWPPDCGAHMRMWQVINALRALRIEVQIVSSHGPLPKRGLWPEDSRRHLQELGIPLHLSPFHVGSVDFWFAAAQHSWERRVLRRNVLRASSRYFVRPQLQRLWSQVIAREQICATLVNYAYWHRLSRIGRAMGVWSGLEMIDLLTEHYRAANPSNETATSDDAGIEAYFQDELRCLSAADCVLAINPEEAAKLRGRLRIPVIDLPYCMDEPRNAGAEVVESDLLVVGSYIEYNKRGLRQFIEGAWPTIKAARPGIRLIVCGRVGEDLAPDTNIVRLIRVPDLAPYYRGAKVVLLTSVAGAGIKIKTIEALSHSSCIVAHKHSVGGTPFRGGQHGEVMDDLGRAAPTVLQLLDAPEQRERLQRNAGALFRGQYESGRGREILKEIFGAQRNLESNR